MAVIALAAAAGRCSFRVTVYEKPLTHLVCEIELQQFSGPAAPIASILKPSSVGASVGNAGAAYAAPR